MQLKTRDADYVFRWGGDEFLLLASCREEEAQRRGVELQMDFSRRPSSAGLPQGVGLSCGCAEVSPFADTAVDALKLAGERMYTNKRSMRLQPEGGLSSLTHRGRGARKALSDTTGTSRAAAAIATPLRSTTQRWLPDPRRRARG
jgi:GGDEF domain-containing protein